MSNRRTIRVVMLLATVFVAFCIGAVSVHAADAGQVKIHMINVGNGDSILVEYNGHYALIDGGRATNSGKYKNGKDVSGACRLDKYSTLANALAGKLSASSTTKFYRDRNLFSFYEHFDNDMKTLRGDNEALTADLITDSSRYLTEFDNAVTVRQAYDREYEVYRQENAKWAEYDDALEGYQERVQAWEQYDKDQKAYEEDLKNYPAALKEYQAEYKAWLERNPDGQDDPDDPMPVEPEEPVAPQKPPYNRPTEADRPVPPAGERPVAPVNNSGLDNTAWNLYQSKLSVFNGIRGKFTGQLRDTYFDSDSDVAMFRSFMELQTISPIKNGQKTSKLFKYYTALGYQYVYKQVDTYMNTTGYMDHGYSECLDYLRTHGIKTLDYVILTHSHVDHVGGLGAVLANNQITVKNILYNGTSYGSGNFRVFEHEMLDRKAAGTSVIKPAENSTYLLGGKVKFTQLGNTARIPAYTREPNQGSTKDKKYMNHIVNNQSLVFRMDFDGQSVLFTGDAEGQDDGQGYNRQEDILSKHKAQLNVDIYKAAHHCHNNASNASFNSAMSPYFVLTSCGKKSEPHKKARKALAGADMWTTSGKGDTIVAVLGWNSFRVLNGSGKDITGSPNFWHSYSIKSNFGTPNRGRSSFKASGRSVGGLKSTGTKSIYYNPARASAVKVTANSGWYYDTVQYQLCAGDRGYSANTWRNGSTATIGGNFRGTVYFRLANKYGRNTVGKTDGFETRTKVGSARAGKIFLNGYNDVTLDWYPVSGASKYKVWIKKGKKWKSKGTTKAIYKTIKNVPSGKRVTFKVQPVGGSGVSYASVITLKKAPRPSVKRSGGNARVSWKGVAGAVGYQVAVSSKVKATVRGARGATVKVTKGKKKFKVRAFTGSNGVIIYGPWSKVKKA